MCRNMERLFARLCDHSSSKKQQLSSFKLKEKLRENYYRVGNLFRHVSRTAINHVHSEPESAAFKVNNEAAEYTRTTSPYMECMNSVLNAILQPGSDSVRAGLTTWQMLHMARASLLWGRRALLYHAHFSKNTPIFHQDMPL